MPDTYAFRLGSVVEDTVTGLHHLFIDGVTTTAVYHTFVSTSTFYVVPAAKTFYATRMNWRVNTDGGSMHLGYGTSNVTASAAAPTGAVTTTMYYINPSANATLDFSLFVPNTASSSVFVYQNALSHWINMEGIEL